MADRSLIRGLHEGRTHWQSICEYNPVGIDQSVVLYGQCIGERTTEDERSLERLITPRTRAIVPVHYAGVACNMDAICEIADRHGIPIIEDCSHAHGALYKGKEIGTFGDVAAFSLMTGKSLPIGEGGILLTDDREVYERAILYSHYVRHGERTRDELTRFAGLPCGGFKHRMHQLSSAFGLVQSAHIHRPRGR